MRLVLAFAIFIFATMGTSLVLGRLAWELRSRPPATDPTGATTFSDEELKGVVGKLNTVDMNILTDEEAKRIERLIADSPIDVARFRELLRSRKSKPDEPALLYTGPAMFASLLGLALGGVFGIMAGRELFRVGRVGSN